MPNLNIAAVRAASTASVTDAGAIVTGVYNKFGMTPPPLSPTVENNRTESYHDPAKLNISYFHPDHLGSSSYITNASGIVTQHLEYMAFGEVFVEEHSNSLNNPFKFNGKELDGETGNYYYGARYYDPKLSTFISVDPLAEKTMSAYGYCYNNPVNLVDPTGMEAVEGDPPSIFGSIWNSIRNWWSGDKKSDKKSNKNQATIEIGQGEWSFLGATTLEGATQTATAVETATAAEAGISAASSLSIIFLPLMLKGDTPEDDEKQYLYRNMRPDGMFFPSPMLGQSANTLGIRPTDVSGRPFNEIISGMDTDGLSTTYGGGNYRFSFVNETQIPNNVPGKTKLFRIEIRDLLPFGLKATPIKGSYWRITPVYDMTIQNFHEKIQATQKLWKTAPAAYK